jgi:selenocysteine lyase/cysteine desulfurase
MTTLQDEAGVGRPYGPAPRQGQDAFLAAHPGYELTAVLDDLRLTDYGYLDEGAHIYLDYTGGGLAAQAQLTAHAERMRGRCFGNPHSENPTSAASTELTERARRRVLEHFNAAEQEYAVIFTPNASAACRIVAEAYPFGPRSRLILTHDNHNSVNGIREFARARGAVTEYVPFSSPELRVSDDAVGAALRRGRPALAAAPWRVARSGVAPWAGRGLRARRQRSISRDWVQDPSRSVAKPSGRRHGRGLFAYPAQSNFSGVQHPLRWIEAAHEQGYDVLLDAAAFAPANRLDLSVVKPDFVPVSWYKVFGYPTGVGCLIARRDALARLWRPWFSGGTIYAVSVQGDWHALAADESRFEDGTLNYLHIPDLEFGLSWVSGIGMDLIHERVTSLTSWLLRRLTALRHSNGEPMALIYGPVCTRARGGTIAFNLLDPHGRVVDERAVARDTAAAGISLRTGCFCNPGAGEGAFNLTRAHVTSALRRGARTVDEYLGVMGLGSGGAIRVSVGLASNVDDVERFGAFIEETYRDQLVGTAGLAPRVRCLAAARTPPAARPTPAAGALAA